MKNLQHTVFLKVDLKSEPNNTFQPNNITYKAKHKNIRHKIINQKSSIFSNCGVIKLSYTSLDAFSIPREFLTLVFT